MHHTVLVVGEWELGEHLLVLEVCCVAHVVAEVRCLGPWRTKLVEQDVQFASICGEGDINHAIAIEVSKLHERHPSGA